ncbi:SusD-like protein P38 [Dyadobacter sp. CECT 9275]|uniref:SusD-like protein P38 n=1 Tax=Dyadobacter helix TaxID=2822344 RepID=A0A916NCR9_9BACT|nr:RagB/SusD family nutrient uptake outer membrane protein [Dyadobacter sp. CECT 9275]CAG5006272.1 SusD-like protein P38 [Dyadobacter sp. CECT 9275]
MKRKIYISILFAGLLSSCSQDFLELSPESSITDGTFFKEQSHFEQALVGAYAALRGIKGSRSAYVMGEMRSDNTFYEYNSTDRGVQYINMELADGFLDDASSNVTNEMYNNAYSVISRANSIITNIPNITLAQDVSDRILGEARFIRALAYFDLVRFYGGLPLYLDQVKGVEDAYLERSTVEQVYAAIEDDLTFAAEKLANPTFPQVGKATKGAAKMLLSDVYITQKKYPLAETQLRDIMGMGYDLLPDYGDVFELGNKNSKESIFEIQYQQGNQGQNSAMVYAFLPITDNASMLTGTVGRVSAGGWNVPTQEMVNTYEAGDQRLPNSISIIEGTGPVGALVIDAVKSPVGYVPTPGKRSYRFINKYLHPHSLINNTDDNVPVYRFSEALLAMAETLNEQDKGAQALEYLNRVRKRAGLAAVTVTAKEQLRAIILHERRVELAFENKRWFDLLRTGQAIDVMTKNGEYLKALYPNLPANSYKLTADRLLFPIPLREIQIAKLQQNPGY